MGQIQGFLNCDWGQEKLSRKFISGTVMKLATGPISWRQKQQSVVTQSFKGADFVALSFAVKDVVWMNRFWLMLRKTMDDSVGRELLAVSIAQDNQACIADARIRCCQRCPHV